MFAALNRRYGGGVIRVNLPRNNHAVVISDPILAKDLFSTSTDLTERAAYGAGTIGAAFGPGSTFSLAGKEHLERRRLLAPPFHGKRMRRYDRIIEEEVMREIATWMPMQMVSKRETNAEVLRGLDNNSPRYLDLVGRHVPKFLQSFGRLFAGTPGTLMYRELQRGRLSYRMYHFTKD
jgi:hypothetical protein